jgi:asparagine synthase (glutamine-hydrolysing)
MRALSIGASHIAASPDREAPTGTDENFIRISRSGGQWAVAGQPHVLLGRSTKAEAERWPVGFVEWNWDGHQLIATTCRYGILPAYWYADDQQIILSDRISGILRYLAPNLEPVAIALLLRMPFLVNDITPFKGVHRLPAGAKLVWADGELHLSGERPQPGEIFAGNRQEAIGRYIELFRAAVQRCGFLLENYAVALSGGRDSRHIFLELIAQGKKPLFCFTALHFPPIEDYDLEVASLLAARLNIEHRVIAQPRDVLPQFLEHNRLVEFCTWEHPWCVSIRNWLGKQYCITDGIAGDVLSAGLFQSVDLLDLAERQEWNLIAGKIIDSWGGLNSKNLYKKNVLDRFPSHLAQEAIVKELQLCACSINPIRDFYFWNRTRRCIALIPFCIFSESICVTPFLDPALFDFLCSLPPNISADKAFHTDVIIQAYPEFADIQFGEISGNRRQPDMAKATALSAALYLAPARRRKWTRARAAYRPLLGTLLGGQRLWRPPYRAIYGAQLSELIEAVD